MSAKLGGNIHGIVHVFSINVNQGALLAATAWCGLASVHWRAMRAELQALWWGWIFAGWAMAQDGPILRQHVSLNGSWEMAASRSAGTPPVSGWQTVEIPLAQLRTGLAAGGSEFLWFRRQVTIEPAWREARVFLWLGGARYHPRVFVNGRPAGEQRDGWTPCEVEITGHVQPGAACSLAVVCQDWGAAFKPGFVLPPDASGDLRSDERMRGQVVAPIGGHWSRFGIWDDVELQIRPRSHLDSLAISPSVRRGQLTVQGRLIPAPGEALAAGRVRARVRDGNRVALELAERPLAEDGSWTLQAPFPAARRWSPEDPHLYALEVEWLTQREVRDRQVEKFGFRELWCEGPDFYLNGVPRHLLASSGWPEPGAQDRQAMREALAEVKAANCVAFRLHTQPWQRRWLDVADELGLLIVEEGALWCDGVGLYDYANPEFWENARNHLLGMVRRDRNHPSLVMWSLENELLHCGACKRDAGVEARLAELGREVKKLDPSRPITFEADLDPGGAADVIGLHYPHEMPEHGDYPNTAGWMRATNPPGPADCAKGLLYRDYHWERKKPLYIGEYLWVPWFNYAPGTVFFGPEAYRLPQRGYELAKAESWRHQAVAYRREGVSGQCPWTLFDLRRMKDAQRPCYEAQKESFTPVAIFPRELWRRAYQGEPLRRSYDVFNDEPRTLELEARAALGGREKTLRLTLPPAGRGEAVFDFGTPPPGRHELVVSLREAAGKLRHGHEATIQIAARRPLRIPAGREVCWWDPRGRLDLGVAPGLRRLERLESIEALQPGKALLLIGPEALDEAAGAPGLPRVRPETPAQRALRTFLSRGGGVLLLEQHSLAGLPLPADLVEHPSTMTFAVSREHPVMKDLLPEDLKFWNPEHHVALRQVRRPWQQGAQTLIVSGGVRELDQGPLVELQAGPGRMLLCQALAGAKWKTEPAAQVLVENCLCYLAQSANPDRERTAWTLGASPEFRAHLRSLGVDAQAWPGGGADGQAEQGAVLILHGRGGSQSPAQTAGSVADFLSGTGAGPRTVYWHAPDADAFATVAARTGWSELAIGPARGPVLAGALDQELTRGLTPEEFTWVGERENYHAYAPDPAIIDRCLTGTGAATGTVFEAEAMQISGLITRREEGKGVWFATAGEARAALKIEHAGIYPVAVVAGGTAAASVYPEVCLQVNGHPAGRVALSSVETQAYGALVELPAGEVEFAAAFVNDHQNGREDRNLFLDRLVLAAHPLPRDRLTLAGQPTVLARLEIAPSAPDAGKRSLVIDCLRWDLAKSESSRGRRYVSALLANLGVAFARPSPAACWVGAPHFDAVGDVPHFRKTATEVTMAAAGKARAEFECQDSGTYELVLRGRSQPAAGAYALARVRIDGKEAGTVEVAGQETSMHAVGRAPLAAGRHTVEVEFTNDLNQDGEDRNLFFEAVGFRTAR